MDKIDKLAKAIASSQTPKGKTKPYDTTAVVKRVEGGIAWVHIADGVPETPAIMAINAKEGDTVRLNVAGGSAYIIGNVDNPPTDDSYAMQAERQAIRAAKAADAASEQATKALTSADTAERNAQRARKAADTAVEDAGTARTAAEQAQAAVVEIEGDVNSLRTRVAEAEETVSDLEDDVDGLSSRVTTAEGKVATAETNIANLQGRVSTAENDIATVEGDITTLQGRVADAEEDVDATLRELSIAQDVVGTINWITSHGTMTNQAGQTFDSNQVYFAVDPNGDYLVGGTRYSVVAEPVASDIANYYLLSISESVQNYVATHIAVDGEGLWIIPDAGGNKVLIATGQGSVYISAGTYIIGKVNNVDTVLASFLAGGATIGKVGGAHSVIDTDGQRFYASDGTTQLANIGYGEGQAQSGTAVAPYYTLGTRRANSAVGNYSVAEGRNLTASGASSHAEGDSCYATGHQAHAEGSATSSLGLASHSEGYMTGAEEDYSHSQNEGTIAAKKGQTALGTYNEEDTGTLRLTYGDYAVIIGNGTSNNNRSNALTVDWNGNVKMALISSGSVTDHDLYQAISDLGWVSDVIE